MADDILDTHIRERAYQIWQDEGQPEGRDAEHWEQARSEFDAARRDADARPAEPAPAKTPGRVASAKTATKPRKPAARGRKQTKS